MSGIPKINERISERVDISTVSDGTNYELRLILFDIDRSIIGKHSIRNVVFRKCIFSQRTISSLTFRSCNFDECMFIGTVIENCEFHNCKIIESNFLKAKISGTYLDPSSFVFSSEWHYKWANINAWWFQVLYRNSMDLHQEAFAMVADKRFQFYRRYEYLFGKRRRPFQFFRSLFYDVFLGYGYGVTNVMIITSLAVVAFAWIMSHNSYLGEKSGIIQSLYFSVVSYTTVGYGDVTPIQTTAALLITTLFLVFSVIWGSLVTAVVVKRLVK